MDSEATKSTREIYDENGGDLTRVAAVMGISVSELQSNLTPAPPMVHRRRQPPADLGINNPAYNFLKPFQISARYTNHAAWPEADESKIEEARAKYEAGTHEICQGRDRDWFPLYCIPRKVRVGARKFFRIEF